MLSVGRYKIKVNNPTLKQTAISTGNNLELQYTFQSY